METDTSWEFTSHDKTSNWYKELQEINSKEKIIAIAYNGKQYQSLEEIKDKVDYNFDSDHGTINGFAFTAWTKTRVYFPVDYDGLEWITSVPRYPSNETTSHIGKGEQ